MMLKINKSITEYSISTTEELNGKNTQYYFIESDKK